MCQYKKIMNSFGANLHILGLVPANEDKEAVTLSNELQNGMRKYQDRWEGAGKAWDMMNKVGWGLLCVALPHAYTVPLLQVFCLLTVLENRTGDGRTIYVPGVVIQDHDLVVFTDGFDVAPVRPR